MSVAAVPMCRKVSKGCLIRRWSIKDTTRRTATSMPMTILKKASDKGMPPKQAATLPETLPALSASSLKKSITAAVNRKISSHCLTKKYWSLPVTWARVCRWQLPCLMVQLKKRSRRCLSLPICRPAASPVPISIKKPAISSNFFPNNKKST